MDNSKEKTAMDDERLDEVAGGWDGEYRYISTYSCPDCGTVNTIRRYCTSGETQWICQKCGDTFTVRF